MPLTTSAPPVIEMLVAMEDVLEAPEMVSEPPEIVSVPVLVMLSAVIVCVPLADENTGLKALPITAVSVDAGSCPRLQFVPTSHAVPVPPAPPVKVLLATEPTVN